MFIFGLKSEYYLYIEQLFGNVDVYMREIDDNINLKSFLTVVESYKKKYELINNHLKIIKGAQIISTFLNYGFLGDIYFQKDKGNNNIILNKNDFTSNLVKLLNPNKLYNIKCNINMLYSIN